MKTISDVFEHTLQDVYWAEKALAKALPDVIKAVSSKELADAFTDHLSETREHARTLEAVFRSIGAEAKGVKCDAMDGLLKECSGLIEEASGAALDAAVIGAAQAVEHYEIARYGTLREWARVLGHDEAHTLLSQILDQEKAANSKLTSLAVDHVNKAGGRAAKASGQAAKSAGSDTSASGKSASEKSGSGTSGAADKSGASGKKPEAKAKK